MALKQRSVGPFTLVPDTAAIAANELIADTLQLAGVCRTRNAGGILQNVTLFDTANQGVALTLVFLQSAVSLGTVNNVPNISAANSLLILGVVPIATADYVSLTASIKVATKGNL